MDRLATRPEEALRTWDLLPQDDGTILITRKTRTRTLEALGFGVAALGFGWLVVRSLDRVGTPIPLQGGGSMPGWVSLLLFTVMEIAFVGLFLWLLAGKEEWRAGPQFFQVDRSILGRSWTRRYEDGHFEVLTRMQTSGLVVAHPVWGVWISDGRRRRRLYEAALASGEREVWAMGELLSRYTGWPLRQAG
ncbi:MAG: hypothetical protein ACK47B_16785 [Armatimonadota bacterium]